MPVLIFIDTAKKQVKKNALEAMCYGAAIAKQLGTTAEGIIVEEVDGSIAELGQYGVQKIYHLSNTKLNQFDAQLITQAIADVVNTNSIDTVVFSNNTSGKAIAPRLSAHLKAGLVSGAISLPNTTNGFVVRKSVFSGKAFADIAIKTTIKIIALNPNAYTIATTAGSAEVIKLDTEVADSKITVTATNHFSGEVSLTEAEIVVSAGRGLKGPENWGMIEDLAKTLKAATACSRPVADAHWRPHNEHVGQTGIAIAPNLYIAIGISGAIQHLAGVNRSKIIVVINKDPEAPFFKAADYGIVGDAFEVVPKLIQEIKNVI